jgi:hypothetical protein
MAHCHGLLIRQLFLKLRAPKLQALKGDKVQKIKLSAVGVKGFFNTVTSQHESEGFRRKNQVRKSRNLYHLVRYY